MWLSREMGCAVVRVPLFSIEWFTVCSKGIFFSTVDPCMQVNNSQILHWYLLNNLCDDTQILTVVSEWIS